VEGENGSGKSSLLRLLAGIATPSDGSLTWCGKEINTSAANYLSSLHYISHLNGLKLGLTIKENLNMLACLMEQPLNNQCLQSELSKLQLIEFLDTPLRFLSAGQKRRVALAKLFLLPRSIWILDEPLTALDIKTQAYFLQRLTTHLQKTGLAIISTHHPIQLPTISIKKLRLE